MPSVTITCSCCGKLDTVSINWVSLWLLIWWLFFLFFEFSAKLIEKKMKPITNFLNLLLTSLMFFLKWISGKDPCLFFFLAVCSSFFRWWSLFFLCGSLSFCGLCLCWFYWWIFGCMWAAWVERIVPVWVVVIFAVGFCLLFWDSFCDLASFLGPQWW